MKFKKYDKLILSWQLFRIHELINVRKYAQLINADVDNYLLLKLAIHSLFKSKYNINVMSVLFFCLQENFKDSLAVEH